MRGAALCTDVVCRVVRDLTLSGISLDPKDFNQLFIILDTGLPHLESLAMRHMITEEKWLEDDAAPAVFPPLSLRLKHLILYYYEEVYQAEGLPTYDADSLLSMLQSLSATLEQLHLPQGTMSAIRTPRAIQLPKLSNLAFVEMEGDVAGFLQCLELLRLESLAFNRCRHVDEAMAVHYFSRCPSLQLGSFVKFEFGLSRSRPRFWKMGKWYGDEEWLQKEAKRYGLQYLTQNLGDGRPLAT
jgi:hypothetical protein